ncbi:DNA polymerase III subunit alpha [Tautonia plasticadhaerens]|uniref:DNA polymerase III subunit alpha n=1 Tax=Tautonia plasticadhaerens TaxID=2527974 RepID=A0A518H1V5_9BACT|nr:DNA polymerase III subunit alpha [Tautonia plasticadhaerens]QDV34828.1 DNA polymerase III subunit alpha [Tautonia plasticadhaerens]
MPSAPPFVHLHCHSHYSLLDGGSRLPELTRRAKALGMEALALTDHGNMYGAVEFLRESKAAGIKPIVGMEAYVAPRHRTDKGAGGVLNKKNYFHLTLLARTGEGFRNLMRLSSAAFLEGYYYKPRIDHEILERHAEGLVCLTGCVSSEYSDFILNDRTEQAEKLLSWYQRIFGPEHVFVEIQNNGYHVQAEHLERSLDFARRRGLPLVATSDAHYLTKEDAESHDVLLCVSSGKTFDDPTRLKFDTQEYFVRSPEEMSAAMPGLDEALKQTQAIAESVEPNYESFGLGTRCFPAFDPPPSKTPDSYLRELCEEGLRERYGDPIPPEAKQRLDHELGIIARMGFSAYFLIVWDFVRYAHEQGIPTTARGSACGALVAYALKLSHVDPLTYDLLFERFLDPNRSEAPDIDIDLCQDRRYEVIEYVRKKYGEENVAQIGTFGTLKAKAAMTDVGRALGIPLAKVEAVKKLVPNVLNITLDEAIRKEPALKAEAERDPDIFRMLEFSRRLEGTVRNVGTHAAGVVIADRPLRDLCPLQKIPNKDKSKEVVSTQWDMGDVEKAGLLKVDFLGLRNLTSLSAAISMIRERYPERPLDLNALPLDDPDTFALLQRGETKGVFQLESAGIRDLLIKMKPDRFADIIATNALYRPGPLNGGMVDSYVNRKHGREPADYPHPVMKDVLEETYGIMVYQEQVMRILNRLGGIELSKAYATIKAISKKKTDVIAAGREAFLNGAVERGLDKAKAKEIFDLIEFFGGYGFNKSHSTAYALVAYQTAYLKSHYPTEYMAAVLSSEMDGSEREKFFVEHIDDCRRMGLAVLPPNINEGHVSFRPSPDHDHTILFGLGALKGVGYKAIESIIDARESGGPFTSLDDFCERVPPREVGQGVIEVLIKAGAFDCLGARRSQLLAVLPRAVQGGQARQEDRKRGQASLFDAFDAAVAVAEPETIVTTLPDVPELSDAERLAEEKKVLGFYMSSHPLTRHQGLIEAFRTHTVDQLAELPDKVEVVLGGILAGVKIKNVQRSRSGLTRMAKLSIEDLTGSTPAMLWPEEFAKAQDLVRDDLICFVRGQLSRQREPAELIVSRIIPIERAAGELCRGLVVRLTKGAHGEAELDRLGRVLGQYQGNLDVYFEVFGLAEAHRAVFRAGASWRVRHDDALIASLESALGPGTIRLLGHRGVAAPPSSC